MTLKSQLFGAACAAALSLTLTLAAQAEGLTAKHVLLISIDGLHEMDVANFIKANPESTMAKLAAHGTHFTNASSAKPSDSFPGLLALITGGTPKSTGVYYDNSYDRMLSPAGSDCKIKGTEAVLDEGVDKDPDAIDGGGGIDEAKLPRDGANGCKPVFPHSFLRTNTIFEVAKAAGMKTAWSDKHPAYDLVNGPSGKGVDDLFVPEINSKGEITSTAALTATYDDTKVAAVINQINGKSSSGKDGAGVPAIFGMNFQAVSVGQKTVGYLDAKGTPQPALGEAIKHTDASLGKIMAALSAKGLDNETLVIVGAKHAQSPIDLAAKKITNEAFIPDAIEGVQKRVGRSRNNGLRGPYLVVRCRQNG